MAGQTWYNPFCLLEVLGLHSITPSDGPGNEHDPVAADSPGKSGEVGCTAASGTPSQGKKANPFHFWLHLMVLHEVLRVELTHQFKPTDCGHC